MKKAKNLILILFIASLAVEYFSNTYELINYPEEITLSLAILVVASIIINIFSKEEKSKKFLNKEVIIVLAVIPLYGLLDYFTEFHLFTNFIIISVVLIIGIFVYKTLKNK
jgi:chromate transport protein ChrA